MGLSQSSLAKRTGLARTTITNIESGGQSLMVHQLFDIAHALRIRPTQILEQIGDLDEFEPQDKLDPQMEGLLMKLTKSVKAKGV